MFSTPWGKLLLEELEQNKITIKYPDTIDNSLLQQADKNPEISGFVYPDDFTKVRAGIYLGDKLIGFFTPREQQNGWRVGAIFIDPEARKLNFNIGSQAIKQFLSSRKAAPVPISITNKASQRAFEKAGFIDTKEKFVEDDGWTATWWVKK